MPPVGSWSRSDGSMTMRRWAVIPPAIANVSASTTVDETMVSPAVAIAPLIPRTHAKEDAIVKIARAVKPGGRAGIGRIVVITVGADRWRTTDANDNLCLSWWGEGKWYE